MSGRFPNTTKVFVGGLPTGTTVGELRDLFKLYGVIADCNVVNRCGFVYLEDKQLAFKAIDELHNFHYKGNRLTVEMGHAKPARGGNGPMRNQRGREHFRGRPYGGERRGGPMRQPPPFMDRRPPFSNDRRTLGESNMMDYHRRPLIEPQGPPPQPQMYDRPPPFESFEPFEPYNIDMYSRRDVPIKPMGGYPLQPPPFQYQQQEAHNQQQEQRRFVARPGPGSGPGPGPGPRRDMPPPRRY